MRAALLAVVPVLLACGGGGRSMPAHRQPVAEPLPTAPEPDGAVDLEDKELEGLRTAGTMGIFPDDLDRIAMVEKKIDRTVGKFRLCVGTDGKPVTASVIEPTALPNYDRKILRYLPAWAYRPYVLDGKPTPFCTLVTFIYVQKERRRR